MSRVTRNVTPNQKLLYLVQEVFGGEMIDDACDILNNESFLCRETKSIGAGEVLRRAMAAGLKEWQKTSREAVEAKLTKFHAGIELAEDEEL